MNIKQLYAAYLRTRKVTTDSRQVASGCLFFALKGEHFDGNQYVPQALEAGTTLCVTSDSRYAADSRCWVVEDVLATLQALAAEHRRHLSIPVIGITGTNGKTTTKELVAAVLSRRYRTAATAGNFNNHLGVPLTLLAIPPEAEIAIVEMGANHPGEIADLCLLSDPDCGLITNVGHAHLEGFGSFEGVVETKTALYRHLASRRGVAFVNADDIRLTSEALRLATLHTQGADPLIPPASPFALATIGQAALGVVSYGAAEDAEVHGSYVGSSPYMEFYFEVADRVYRVHSHLLGAYNFANCMAAVAVGLHFGVEPWDIKDAIEAYIPSNHRSEYKETARGNRLYLDCYNANPSSMAAAIAAFAEMVAPGRKMAIIGGMHELGSDEHCEHQLLVQRLAECHLDRCLLVGPEFEGISLPPEMQLFATTDELLGWLGSHTVTNATVLVKGSNTNRLWSVEEFL